MTSQDHKYWASTLLTIAFILGMLAVLVWIPNHPGFAVFCAIMAVFA